jgi:hypothetical protein
VSIALAYGPSPSATLIAILHQVGMRTSREPAWPADLNAGKEATKRVQTRRYDHVYDSTVEIRGQYFGNATSISGRYTRERVSMKKAGFAAVFTLASSIGWATPPDENLVKSCLQAQSVTPSITIRKINADEVFQEDDYADGFNASYIFKYKNADVGYAEKRSDLALIYSGKLYRLSHSTPLGNNGEIKPAAFNPTLAQWSIAKEGRHQYLCVSFNFDGLGRSGSFQHVHGGYLLNSKTKNLYFVVRDIK